MKCEVLPDWLTFTVKADNPNDVIRDWLGMEPDLFESFPYGINGYLQSKRFSSIIVAYSGYETSLFSSVEMGVCVSMSGEGCRTFDRYSTLGFMGLAEKLARNMYEVDAETGDWKRIERKSCICNCSRFDIACDDKSGLLDMGLMFKKLILLHEYNSRMRKPKAVLGKDGDEWDGRTLYVGCPSSSFRMRIYDKAQEQKEKGNWKESVKDSWIRVEMVMKDENAAGFLKELVKMGNVGKLAAQVLNDKFRFIERDDSNISRCSVSDWWASFVEEVDSVVIFSRTAIQHSLHRVETWLRNQVSSSMAMIVLTMGYGRLRDIALEGEERLSRRQEALVHDFNAHRAASVVHLQTVGALSV